jgi:hypothetical protein
MSERFPMETIPPEMPVTVRGWVYRLEVEPPARHDGWRRAIRVLLVRRPGPGRRRRG